MPLLSETHDSPVRCALWKLTESAAELAALHPRGDALLSEAERQFSAPRRIREWVAVRLLLHLIAPEETIGYLPSGRPVLQSGSAHITVSHTDGYVAVALSPTPIGIDIERLHPRVMKVARRFLNEAEQQFALSDLTVATLCWCAKEAIYKLLDLPAVDFAAHLHLAPFVPNDSGTFSAHETLTDEQRAFTVVYKVHDDFALCLSRHVEDK